MKSEASRAELQADDVLLTKLIAGGLDHSKWSFERIDASETRILNLACGTCREAEELADFFSGIASPFETRVSLIGIEKRLKALAFARRHFKSRPGRDFNFICEDGREVGSIEEADGMFDVVVFRHQNYWQDKPVWRALFAEGLAKLSPTGVMVVTSYFDKEHGLALGAIQGIGGRILTTTRNEASRELPVEGKSVDRHVALVNRYRVS